MMLLIPLPLLIRAHLPWKRKIVLCGVFSLGIFVILAAILNRYYNFTAGYGSLIYLNWYAGEAATAVMVTNIPHCWPLLSRVFRLGSFKISHDPSSSMNNRYSFGAGKHTTMSSALSRPRNRPDEHGYIRSESEERIANAGAGAGFLPTQTPPQAVAGGETPIPRDVEMGALPEGSGYIGTAVMGGKEWGKEGKEDEGTIVKTVQMHQYSS